MALQKCKQSSATIEELMELLRIICVVAERGMAYMPSRQVHELLLGNCAHRTSFRQFCSSNAWIGVFEKGSSGFGIVACDGSAEVQQRHRSLDDSR
jgi:hypothetical protein